MENRAAILRKVSDYYGNRLRQHGATARGVDWNSSGSQRLRFEQLLQIVRGVDSFSINDYGCGYGELSAFLVSRGWKFDYLGCDVSEDMIAEARKRSPPGVPCRFVLGDGFGRTADYTVASGVFNVRQDVPIPEWEEYVFESLALLNGSSVLGFSFNCLTSYSDEEQMRGDLYYADPRVLFDYCKRHFARNVALLHDYGLYEFTMLVRKTDI